MSRSTDAARDPAQARTIATLVSAQAVGAVGITIGIATASLLATDVSGSERQAGLVQTCQVLGAAVASWLLARLMSARGRRVGLVTGLLVGALGSALCVVAGVIASMPLLLVGAALLGATTAANSGARYAATDLAPAQHKARALSIVVWATTIGAVAGPNLTGPAATLSDRLGIPELTGPFAVGAIAMLLAAVVVGIRLRPDPLLLARERAGIVNAPSGTSWGRTLEVWRERRDVLAAVVGLALAHAVMVAVMVMTPLHMQHGGSHLRLIGIVISGHVLGMFAFSPLMGWAADRLGRPVMLLAGACVLLLSLTLCGSSPDGTSWQIATGLFLLGLGWSAATVASSTLLTERTPLDARTDVQGSADLVMGVTAAAAGGAAGLIMGGPGFAALSWFAAVLAVGVGLSALAAMRSGRPRPTESLPTAD